MQVNADWLVTRNLHRARGQFADLLRAGIADGVGDRDHVDTSLEQFFGDPQHFSGIDGADDRTAQRHRNRGVDDRLVFAGVAQFAEPPDVGDRRLTRTVGVGLTVLLGGRHHGRDFGNARGQRLVDAALVQGQRDAVSAGKRSDSLDDVADVDELRKGFGGQERTDLEMPHARGILLADPALLGGRGRKRLHQLQAVAQAHFAQDDLVIGIDVLKTGHDGLTQRCRLRKACRVRL